MSDMTDQSRATAPASGAGLIYQFERALPHLATSHPDSAVGIETLDDVTVKLTSTGDPKDRSDVGKYILEVHRLF